MYMIVCAKLADINAKTKNPNLSFTQWIDINLNTL